MDPIAMGGNWRMGRPGSAWDSRLTPHRRPVMTKKLEYSLAPEKLWQAINPWTFYQQGAQFGLINIELGQTPHPEIEQEILDEVGSYGRQLGRIGDALEILIKYADLSRLDEAEKGTIKILEGQLAQIREVKRRVRAEV
jgi:hypothetical protein